MPTMSSYRALQEAKRRYIKFHYGEPLTEACTGLGFPSEYKAAIQAGTMEWMHGPPRPRTMGWLRLTTFGASIVRQWLDKEEA